METQALIEPTKKKPPVVTSTTRIASLIKISTEAKKSSISLRKTFENGVYQRKTQLSVLNRYKHRLDVIQKEQDKKYQKKKVEKPKKVEIPKFIGSFFTKGSSDDPLKAIGALAAFNSLDKFVSGDFLGGLGSGAVAAGSLLGPKLAFAGAKKLFSPKGDVSKKAVDATSKTGRVAKAFGKFGSSIIPGVGAVVGAADAAMRAQSGDITGASIAGTGAALDAAAAASAATGIGLPIAGLLSIASFTLDAVNLIRDLTGVSANEEQKNKKLKEQTKKEKELSRAKGNLTFSKTLVGYEKALIKFEEFSKNFKGGILMSPEQVREEASRIEDLGAGSNPMSGPGHQFTTEPTFSQYLTGDPSSPGYDYSHGTVDNYHDHFAFKDRATMQRAAAFLQSKGIVVTEMDVSSGHSPGSAHYEGRAFDVPGHQWGGTGDIGPKEYNGSARVRALMNDFYAQDKGGANRGAVVTGPKTGYPVILHGKEAIIPLDNYHTQGGGDPLQNVPVDVINTITTKSRIYQTAINDIPPEVISVSIPVIPPQIQYVSSGSEGVLNIEDDADKKLLKMLFYSALG